MTVAVKNNSKVPLVVPPAVLRTAGFKSGQELEFKATGGVITIVPKAPSVADEYTAAERRAIDRGIAVRTIPNASVLEAFPPQLFQSAKGSIGGVRKTVPSASPESASPVRAREEVR